MLDIYKNAVLLCYRKKFLVMFQQLNRWLSDENVYAAFNCVTSDWVVSSVRGEDCDCIAISKLINIAQWSW